MPSQKHIESQEMYLKAINKIFKDQNCVRAIDICEETGYKKSSVSRAVALLESGNYIRRDKKKYITLTEKGKNVTEFVEDRYNVCFQLLIMMGLNEQEADKIACELEHIIDCNIYEKLKNTLLLQLKKKNSKVKNTED